MTITARKSGSNAFDKIVPLVIITLFSCKPLGDSNSTDGHNNHIYDASTPSDSAHNGFDISDWFNDSTYIPVEPMGGLDAAVSGCDIADVLNYNNLPEYPPSLEQSLLFYENISGTWTMTFCSGDDLESGAQVSLILPSRGELEYLFDPGDEVTGSDTYDCDINARGVGQISIESANIPQIRLDNESLRVELNYSNNTRVRLLLDNSKIKIVLYFNSWLDPSDYFGYLTIYGEESTVCYDSGVCSQSSGNRHCGISKFVKLH